MKEQGDSRASSQNKYEGHHYAFGPGDHSAAIAAGRRFFSITGEPLPTIDSVRAAMKRDGEVVSR